MDSDVVIWDWNGTILNDLDAVLLTLNEMLSIRGLPFESKDKYKSRFKFPVIEYYKELGFDFQKEDFHDASVEYVQLYNKHNDMFKLTDGVIDVLEHFKKMNKKQYVLSALDEICLRDILQKYGLIHYFEDVFGSDNIYGSKKVDTGRRLLNVSGVDSSDCVMIGDTEHDAEVAFELGFKCVLYTGGHNNKERLVAVASTIDMMKELM